MILDSIPIQRPSRGFLSRIGDFFAGRASRAEQDAPQKLLQAMIPVSWQHTGEPELSTMTTDDMVMAFEREAMIYAAVHARATDVSALPIKITLDGEEVLPPWPDALTMFDSANPHESFGDLVYALCVDFDLTGEFFSLWDAQAGQLWWLPSYKTTVLPGPGALVAGYEVDLFGVKSRFIPDEVVSGRRHGPRNVINGISPILPLERTVKLLSYQEAFEAALMKNQARPSGFLSSEHPLSEPAKDAALKSFRLAYGGAKNAGKVALLAGNLKYQQVSLNPIDVGLQQAYDRCERNICKSYGVPLARLVGDNRNFATAENEMFVYWSSSLGPLIAALEQAFNRVVFAGVPGAKIHFDTSRVIYLQRAQKDLYTTALAATGNNAVITQNEARTKLLGLPPIDDPAADRLNQPVFRPYTFVDVSNPPPEVPTVTQKDAQTQQAPATKLLPDGALSRRVAAIHARAASKRAAHQLRVLDREARTVREQVALPVLRSMLDADREAVKAWDKTRSEAFRETGVLSQFRTVQTPHGIEIRVGEKTVDLPDAKQFIGPLTDDLQTYLVDAYQRLGAEAWDLLMQHKRALYRAKACARVQDQGVGEPPPEDPNEYDTYDPRVSEALKKRTVEIKTVPIGVQEIARNVLKGCVERGESMAQMDDALGELFSQLEEWEANRIAFTESGSACNLANQWAMEDAGASKKKWIQANGSQDKRETHTANMNQGEIKFEDRHLNQMLHPQDDSAPLSPQQLASESINCGCVEVETEFYDV